MYIYCLTVSLGEESGSGSGARFQVRNHLCHEVTVRLSTGAVDPEGLAGAEGSTSKMVPSPRCGQETSVPYLTGLSIGLLTAWLHPE